MATDTNRKLIPLTNDHFAAWCLKMLGQPYWYGCVVYKCSESLRARKAAQYPAHYGASRTSRYQKDTAAKKVAADCIGAAKGYAWTGGGVGVLESIGTDRSFVNRYGSNNCPDKSANGMFSYAKSKGMDCGKISVIPDIVGLAVHMDGHVGYTVGNGYVVEWRGFSYGCVKTKLKYRPWKYWYKLPFIHYGAVSTPGPSKPVEPIARHLSYKTSESMLRGDDVRMLQVDLGALGYASGNADGIFGQKTDAAVRAFQRDHDLEVDGVVGRKTRAALGGALEHVGSDPEAQVTEDEHAEGEAPDSGENEPDGDNDGDYIAPVEKENFDFGTRLLRYRKGHTYMTGNDVAAIQKRLIQLGHVPGKVDGIYGPGTAAAVKGFQTARGIEADGIVGAITRAELVVK